MQFQVPQFIEVEDKIVGPLTLKQFLYLAAVGAVCFFLYFFLQLWLWMIFAFILGSAGAALAFLKINGRPFIKIMVSAFHYYWQPQLYLWQPETPNLPKTESALRSAVPGIESALERILAGNALKSTWQKVSTGSTPGAIRTRISFQQLKERYQIFQRITGERRAAKRIDYR